MRDVYFQSISIYIVFVSACIHPQNSIKLALIEPIGKCLKRDAKHTATINKTLKIYVFSFPFFHTFYFIFAIVYINDIRPCFVQIYYTVYLQHFQINLTFSSHAFKIMVGPLVRNG